MASLNNVIDLCGSLNSSFTQINSSYDPNYTRRLIETAISSLSEDCNWGRSSIYLENLSASLNDLKLTIDTDMALDVIDDVNQNLSDLFRYFNTSWWQFTGDDSRGAVASLPTAVKIAY